MNSLVGLEGEIFDEKVAESEVNPLYLQIVTLPTEPDKDQGQAC